MYITLSVTAIHACIHVHVLLCIEEDEDDEGSDASDESSGKVLSAKDMEGLYQGGNKEVWRKVISPPPTSRAPIKEPHFGALFWCDDIPASVYAFWESKSGGFGSTSSNTDTYIHNE